MDKRCIVYRQATMDILEHSRVDTMISYRCNNLSGQMLSLKSLHADADSH
mgnify:CR=1 FL=1